MYYDGLLYLSLCLKLSWTFLASVVLLVSALRFSLFRLFTNDILLWLTRLYLLQEYYIHINVNNLSCFVPIFVNHQLISQMLFRYVSFYYSFVSLLFLELHCTYINLCYSTVCRTHECNSAILNKNEYILIQNIVVQF